MLGPPDRGGLGPAEHMHTNRPRSRKGASGETSMAGVPTEFVAAKAAAGERQSTLRGYNAALRAAKDLGWIGSVIHQLHKRIA